MIHLLRASHANEFELQNYAPIAKKLDIRVITSQHPLTPVSLPTIPLWSPTDLPPFPYRRQILSRLIGGEQWLIGLEKYVKSCYHVLEHGNKNDQVVVHTAETYTPYTHQAVELRKRGVIKKLICTCWETRPHNNEKFTRLRKWKQEAYRYVDCFHTPTERAKQALITEGVHSTRIIVIPYGVDLTRFHSTKRVTSKRPRILTVARLEKEKGVEDLEAVARQLPDYDFSVIGSGSYTPRRENISVKQVPYSHIHRAYESANLFFLPSRTTSTWEEQYGMVLVEAMASGLPIVTTNSGAIPQVVGNAGIICEIGDVDNMVTSITEIITNQKESMRLSKRALTRTRDLYDAKQAAQKLAKLYDSISR